MFRNKMIIGSAICLFLSAGMLLTQDNSKLKAEHLAQAKEYEEQAKAESKIAEAHAQMKKDYFKKHWINEKLSSKQKIKEMEDHCDKIVKEATTLQKHFELMAAFHKSSAAMLDKK